MNREPRMCAKKDCGRMFTPSDPRAIFCGEHHFWAIGQILGAIQAGAQPESAVKETLAQGKPAE